MNVCFETFGCRLNRAEALEDEAQCIAKGHRIVHSHGHADVIVVRGCSVTGRAQRDCEQLIAHIRRKYPNTRIITLGCLSGASKTLSLPASHKLTPSSHSTSTSSLLTPHSSLLTTHSSLSPLPTSTSRAYLKVQDGCAGKCTFCIVPKFRGESVSLPFDELIAKATRFIESGYHEIVITGCNLALYASQGKRLPDLLAALASLSPDCRIRLGSLEPWGPAREVIDVMGDNPNLCRFLHLPVQSGSNRILAAMKRPYQVEDVTSLVEHARALMPDIALGCDIMTGFPGETEGDFMQTRIIMTRHAYVNAHVFPYSERPGTPAANLPSIILHSVRSNRAHTISDVAQANKTRFARRFVGRNVDVVIESHGKIEGWTSEYLWFKGPVQASAELRKNSLRKQMLKFTVRSAEDGILHGVLAKDNGR